MAYIYKITNDINDKVYIGKTEFSIEKRWKEHCNDCQKRQEEKRPLYAAMRKYGIEHFSIELIEETNFPESREQYWIEHYGSFKYGYNATIGGDGKRYLDYDLIVATYKEVQNVQETAQLVGASVDSVHNVLTIRKIPIRTGQEIIREKYGKKIAALDKVTGKTIKVFPTIRDGARWLHKNHLTKTNDLDGIAAHIRHVISGKRKTAYGYGWKQI